jgi:hypothetical protein
MILLRLAPAHATTTGIGSFPGLKCEAWGTQLVVRLQKAGPSTPLKYAPLRMTGFVGEIVIPDKKKLGQTVTAAERISSTSTHWVG